MKVRLLTASAVACLLFNTIVAQAQDTPPPVTGNVAMVSDYMFRGITQSWGHPAIQGGADFTAPNGFAVGTWASSISDKSYAGGSMELDVYASFGRPIDSDWSWRVGVYGYLYPGANLRDAGYASHSFNTAEANAALTWRQFTLKYNRSLTDYFAADREQGYDGNSRGTGYLQLDAALALSASWSLALHAGHTHYTSKLAMALANGPRDASYSDFSAMVKYQLAAHWSVSGGVTHATDASFYRHVSSYANASDTRNTGGTRGLIQFQGTF